MSTLTNERKILREIYNAADQAVEYLSIELGKVDDAWISETGIIFRENIDDPAKAHEAIKDHLRKRPMGYFENTAVTNHLATLLFGMHAAGEELRNVNNMAEVVLESVRLLNYGTLQGTQERGAAGAGSTGDDRQQGHRRPGSVLTLVSRQSPDGIGGHWRRQDPNEGDAAEPPGDDQPRPTTSHG